MAIHWECLAADFKALDMLQTLQHAYLNSFHNLGSTHQPYKYDEIILFKKTYQTHERGCYPSTKEVYMNEFNNQKEKVLENPEN